MNLWLPARRKAIKLRFWVAYSSIFVASACFCQLCLSQTTAFIRFSYSLPSTSSLLWMLRWFSLFRKSERNLSTQSMNCVHCSSLTSFFCSKTRGLILTSKSRSESSSSIWSTSKLDATFYASALPCYSIWKKRFTGCTENWKVKSVPRDSWLAVERWKEAKSKLHCLMQRQRQVKARTQTFSRALSSAARIFKTT